MPERRGSRFITRLWAVIAATLALLAVLVGIAIEASRGQHEEQEAVSAWAMARVLESDLQGLFANLDLALLMMAEAWDAHGAAVGKDTSHLDFRALELKAALADLEMVRVADAEGRLVAGTDRKAGTAQRIDDLPYFGRLAEPGAAGLVIDGPFVDRITGKDVVVLARRLRTASGGFGGVVTGAVSLARVTRALGDADIGPHGEVTLYHLDLRTLARHPVLPGTPDAAARPVPAPVREAIERAEPSAAFRGMSPHDGVERIVAFRRLERFPLALTVARAPQDYLGHWRRDARTIALLALLLGAVALVSAAMVHRAWRGQQSAAQRLQQLARTDELTGLANRRRFFEVAEAERQRAARYGSRLAILMLDIDHFKEVNDAHGHSTGDIVLQHLATCCQAELREVDLLGRIGGEEFAVLLPETGLEAAGEVAERLRAAVARTSVARPEGLPIRFTVSLGGAALDDGENLDMLISRADSALYRAKHEGRNRVRLEPAVSAAAGA